MAAGIYYPADPITLRESIDSLLSKRSARERVVALIVPHGDLRTVGAIAARLYSRTAWTPGVVVVGPNHSQVGALAGIAPRGSWQTPLGEMPVDERLARWILKRTPDLEQDVVCHRDEHSIELQIPFLQRVGGVRAFVPICIGSCGQERVERIGEGVGQALAEYPEPVTLIATTLLSRYEPKELAEARDREVIDAILALDERRLMEISSEGRSSMCGAEAAAVVLAAAKKMGAGKVSLAHYDLVLQEESAVGLAAVVIRS